MENIDHRKQEKRSENLKNGKIVIISDLTRQKIKESKKGIRLSDYHKQRISETRRGENNPFYGKKYKWITDGVTTKRIPEFDPLPLGFRFGRI